MKYQIQTKPEGRRQSFVDVELFDGTEVEAVAHIEAKSAEDGRPWRFGEAQEQAKLDAGGSSVAPNGVPGA